MAQGDFSKEGPTNSRCIWEGHGGARPILWQTADGTQIVPRPSRPWLMCRRSFAAGLIGTPVFDMRIIYTYIYIYMIYIYIQMRNYYIYIYMLVCLLGMTVSLSAC